MKINQYCSVCKKHLDMEVIPTDDGGDDGVVWLRCPECQGFLPKFTGGGAPAAEPEDKTAPRADAAVEEPAPTSAEPDPSAVTEAPAAAPPVADAASTDLEPGEGPEDEGGEDDEAAAEPEVPAEPLDEYAALLAEADPGAARPYRPDSAYEVGDVVHHLAYDDIGIVVAKESLPGGRRAVKVYFDTAGLVHLIEQAAGKR